MRGTRRGPRDRLGPLGAVFLCGHAEPVVDPRAARTAPEWGAPIDQNLLTESAPLKMYRRVTSELLCVVHVTLELTGGVRSLPCLLCM